MWRDTSWTYISVSLVLALSLDIMWSRIYDEWILLERKKWTFLSCFDFIAAGSGDTVIALLSKFWINEEVNKIELGY